MISVDDLPQIQGPLPVVPGEALQVEDALTDDEQVALDYIDAQIETVASSFQGDGFNIAISYEVAPANVMSALKKRWESGGWIVCCFAVEGGCQFVFAKPRYTSVIPKIVTKAMAARKAEPLYRGENAIAPEKKTSPRTSTPLLIRMPTRGRPEQALAVLGLYRTMADERVKIEVIIDEDDASMNNTRVLQRLYDLDCVIHVGRHHSKIEAVNSGHVDDWAIMALVSDDMVPVVQGYDTHIIEGMKKHFPLLDGAIYFNDGFNRDHVREGQPVLCTLPIFGRYLYEQFGYVYYPGYKSLYCDDEQTQLLTQMKRIQFIDEYLIEHRHHAAGKAAVDAVYAFNDELSPHDKALLAKRMESRSPGSQFAFDAPEMLLSILICSTTARADKLARLVEHLRHQIHHDMRRRVELVVDIDDRQITIGEKRQRLLERAVGTYVAFVDDDDWVDSRYVDRIAHAIWTEPHADCLSLVGVLTTNGENPERFEHSLKYTEWATTKEGLHVRTPNHLNAIRRELALQVGFGAKSFGEDHDFSRGIYPLLKNEVSTGDEPLYMYWVRKKEGLGL